jgi:hypothetical protein
LHFKGGSEHNRSLSFLKEVSTDMGFARFMASAAGRALRIIAGLALIAGGIALYATNTSALTGIILTVVGLVPLAAGVFDFCIFAPLGGAPFSGAKIRALSKVKP